MTDALQSRLTRYQWLALALGIAALCGCVAGAFFNMRQFFISYLFGYLFWLGLALGCLGVVMIHHLTGGRWGFVVRRFLESGFRTLPLMALLFVPLFFGLGQLYPWANSAKIAGDHVLRH